MNFRNFCKYIYIKDKRTGKTKKFIIHKHQYEMLHAFINAKCGIKYTI